MQWLKGKVNGPDMQLVCMIRLLCAPLRLLRRYTPRNDSLELLLLSRREGWFTPALCGAWP
jgi:hypothetical protein